MAAAVAAAPLAGSSKAEKQPAAEPVKDWAKAMATEEDEDDEDEAPAAGEEVLSGSDLEEMENRDDLVALVRASLGPGGELLDASEACKSDPASEQAAICNNPRLLELTKELQFRTPEGAKRVPWVEFMVIDAEQRLPENYKAKYGVMLETEFINMAGVGVKEAYRRLNVMKEPCHRPLDYHSEMFKPDKNAHRGRQRAAEESRRQRIGPEVTKKSLKKKKKAKTTSNSQVDSKSPGVKDLSKSLGPRKASAEKGGGKGKGKDERVKRDKFGNVVKCIPGKKRFAKSGSMDLFSQAKAGVRGKGKGKGKSKGKGKGKVSGTRKERRADGGKAGSKKRKRGAGL